MARKTSSRSGGSTLYGILAGLVIGLAAAVAVALFVTQVPMPFVDKASRDPAQTLLPDARDAPDPNIALYGKGSAAGVAPSGPTDTTIAPLAGTKAPGIQGSSLSDSIGDLIATLGAPDSATHNKPVPSAKAGAAPVPDTAGSAAAPAPKAHPTTKAAPASGQTTYYLQAGAFRSERDAETIKARILLLGLPAQVQKAQVNGATINRVRVGPFKGIDEMNRSRVRLGEEKIVSSVVRQ